MKKYLFKTVFFETDKSEEKTASAMVDAPNLIEARKELYEVMKAKQYYDWYELSHEEVTTNF